MKKIFTLFAVVLFTTTLFAQSPEKMSYQAVIRNSSGQLVTSHAVGMQISILQGSASGTAVYVEKQTPTSNANGLVSIEIGGGTVVSGDFAAIDWSAGPYFIKTETDPVGSTSYTITGTSQLLSVPFALYAKSTETADTALYAYAATTSDTAIYALTAGTADTATYARTAKTAKTAETAETVTTETDPGFTAWNEKHQFGSVLAAVASAPDSIVAVGDLMFRYSSTSTDGTLQVMRTAAANYHMSVNLTKKTYTTAGSTSTLNYYDGVFYSTSAWMSVLGSTTVTVGYYSGMEGDIHAMTSTSSGSLTSESYHFRIYIDGYGRVNLMVWYDKN